MLEKERAPGRAAKHPRDTDQSEESDDLRFEMLAKKVARLEHMIHDLHSAKFGQCQSRAGQTVTVLHKEASNSPSPKCMEVETVRAVEKEDLLNKEVDSGLLHDPYDFVGIIPSPATLEPELENVDAVAGAEKNEQLLRSAPTEVHVEADVTPPSPSKVAPENANIEVTFQKGMPVKLIGLEKGKENLVVGGGVVHGVAGDSCHEWKMLADEVSVVVDATYEDNYEIYRPINNDDPPITRMEQCVGMFIVWDSACMRLVPHAEKAIKTKKTLRSEVVMAAPASPDTTTATLKKTYRVARRKRAEG